jgi:hypothetical protein
VAALHNTAKTHFTDLLWTTASEIDVLHIKTAKKDLSVTHQLELLFF